MRASNLTSLLLLLEGRVATAVSPAVAAAGRRRLSACGGSTSSAEAAAAHTLQQQPSSTSCGLLQRQQQHMLWSAQLQQPHCVRLWPACATSPLAAAAAAAAATPGVSSSLQSACYSTDSSLGPPGNSNVEAVRARTKQRADSSKAAQMAKMFGAEFRALTLGHVADRYSRRPPLLHALHAALAGPQHASPKDRAWAAVAEVRARVLGALGHWVAMLALNNIPGFDKRYLNDEIAKLYLDINTANANMQPDLIRDLVSKDMLVQLRARAERRRTGQKWAHIDWELVDSHKLRDNIQCVQARYLRSSRTSPITWYQLTFCISSKQRFAAYRLADASGKRPQAAGSKQLVQGDPGVLHEVHDYWVVERKVHKGHAEGSRWRLVAELAV